MQELFMNPLTERTNTRQLTTALESGVELNVSSYLVSCYIWATYRWLLALKVVFVSWS